MIKFEAGKKYLFRFIGDADLKPFVTIVSRTEKTVSFIPNDEVRLRTAKIHLYDGYEMFYPFGKYSLSPVVKANSIK